MKKETSYHDKIHNTLWYKILTLPSPGGGGAGVGAWVAGEVVVVAAVVVVVLSWANAAPNTTTTSIKVIGLPILENMLPLDS